MERGANMTDHTNKYKYLGTNDDQSFCCLCGKEELIKVIWLENTETGEIAHYGVCCGAKLQGIKTEEFKVWIKEEKEKIKEETRFEIYKKYCELVKYGTSTEKIETVKKWIKDADMTISYFNKVMFGKIRRPNVFKIKK